MFFYIMGRSQLAPSVHKLSIKLECTWLTSLSVFGGFWLVRDQGKDCRLRGSSPKSPRSRKNTEVKEQLGQGLLDFISKTLCSFGISPVASLSVFSEFTGFIRACPDTFVHLIPRIHIVEGREPTISPQVVLLTYTCSPPPNR